MISKGFLIARPVGNLIQRRGKSIQNWKRPTMDEYLGPKENYEKMAAKRSKEGTMYLLGGLAFVVSTVLYMIEIDFIDAKPNPMKWPGVKEGIKGSAD